ncbi:hypothetical protein HETIRDRAFT_448251 [Heterobasidion irregulare TC 32-1]|uniref:Uncharacterized protein n=1 Tax=Heterobasidion irregulare (strain TC 32-1) TaxID=747525 RepID=W4KGI8_HETIT|nr:uncharacterized protein HETIRDRAFT_448251 [Heterobasidion irregulare TC 32-1]ETW84978.1 hypothetical protein HETIRDRAFT_448251 [Heterobasidion irregulare TC 32-1]
MSLSTPLPSPPPSPLSARTRLRLRSEVACYPPAYRLQPTLVHRLDPPRCPALSALVLSARAQIIAKRMPRTLQCVDEEVNPASDACTCDPATHIRPHASYRSHSRLL